MTIDIHKVITGNPITKNLMQPWAVNAKKSSLRSKMFGNYVGPGNCFHDCKNSLNQVDLDPNTGEIIEINDVPNSKNQWVGLKHDHKYYLGERFGSNKADIKRRKLEADADFLKEYKIKSPFDAVAYSAIKSKKVLGLGKNNSTMEDLSNELNKPVINKFSRKEVIINHIDEIHSCDLVDMSKYSKMNKEYKYIFTNIDIFSKYAWSFAIKSKTIKDIKPCFEKIFKEQKPEYIWSDQESSFFFKEMLKFFENNNVKIYHTYSNLKAVVIERFNRSLRELMMKKFVKSNNTVWYNVLPNLIKTYNNRYHRTIKMKPINVNKTNEKYIKNNFYIYDVTNKIPKFKINDLVRISLKRRELFDKRSGNIKWSEELFKIHSINKSNVITYEIKDSNDEMTKGIFYERELQKTRNTGDQYIIEKILKPNKNKIYVKWRGYNSSFNSWIDKNSVIKYI